MKDRSRLLRRLSLIEQYLPYLVVAIFILLLFIFNYGNLSSYFTKDNPKGELFKVSLTVVAGIVASIALYYSAKRVTAIEKGNVDTRFNNAVGYLGNNNPTVVLGGIHTLHQIAVGNKNYQQIVHNLFCSYLRENSAKLYKDVEQTKSSIKCPVSIQMLIDYLFKFYNDEKSIYCEFKSDLSGSILKKCDFSTAILTNCIFNSVTLSNCRFDTAKLIKCLFDKSALTNCCFHFTQLTDCSFDDARLTRCDFGGAIIPQLTKENLGKAILIDCLPASIISPS
ncbi:hypothetical protein AGMMS49525_15460 [Bacteroidia bacterium]|nr:hypothetical protein AGMMS49525_15460 [Bacteroidia bacterium]